MKVPYGEELAIHTGPESCVDSRKAIGEALTGGVWAGLLSRERCGKLQGADAVHKVEGNTGCIDTARCSWTLRGQRPRARTQAPFTGTGRSHARPRSDGPGSARRILSEQGRDARAWEVGQANMYRRSSRTKAGAIPAGGGCGGKGPDQGESALSEVLLQM